MKEVIEKIADKVYNETDFGRSIATSLAGIIGLIAYLLTNDWVIALFSSIISFPIIRLSASGLHKKINQRIKNKEKQKDNDELYNELPDEEKDIVQDFVKAGGCVLLGDDIDKFEINWPGLRTLIERKLVEERELSTEHDYPVYEYAMKMELYDAGNRKRITYNEEAANQRRDKRLQDKRLEEEKKKSQNRSRQLSQTNRNAPPRF